jgi:hypothetical protein
MVGSSEWALVATSSRSLVGRHGTQLRELFEVSFKVQSRCVKCTRFTKEHATFHFHTECPAILFTPSRAGAGLGAEMTSCISEACTGNARI